MNKLIIGCDPDSEKSGFAFYEDGKLVNIKSMSDIEFYQLLDFNPYIDDITLHIENVNGNRCSSFGYKKLPNKQSVRAKYSEGVGKCKQAQVAVERIAEHFGIEIIRHPVSSKWKSQKEKAEFQEITGWTERSNEDTRSAAWFGYQATLKEGKKIK